MLNTKRMMGWLVLIGCCTTGVAVAQQSGMSGELERAGKVAPREMAAFARSATEEILGASKTISRMVDQARRDNELEEVNCLESRLSYVRALLMVTERANGAMKFKGTADRFQVGPPSLPVVRTRHPHGKIEGVEVRCAHHLCNGHHRFGRRNTVLRSKRREIGVFVGDFAAIKLGASGEKFLHGFRRYFARRAFRQNFQRCIKCRINRGRHTIR